VIPAGDHFIVLGRVRDLDVAEATAPLIFYQGGYGRFSPSTLAANDADLMEQLAVVDVARPHMTELSTRLGVECVAIALVNSEVAVVASSGAPRTGRRLTRVGTRVPFSPPGGYVFAAWAPDPVVQAWVSRHARPDQDDDVDTHRRRLARIRERGFSLGLGGAAHHHFGTAARALRRSETGDRPAALARLISILADDYEPENLTESAAYPIETVTAPIFDEHGSVVLALVLYGSADTTAPTQVSRLTEPLLAAASAVTATIGGQRGDNSKTVAAASES
jgi:DNA-binding IclR family transcriptional regulator